MPLPTTLPYDTPLRNPFDDPIEHTDDISSHAEYPPTPISSAINSSKPLGHIRTPSPTPSEAKELEHGAIDWTAMKNWRFWFRKEWLWYYVALVVIITIVGLIAIFHTQIVHWLTPATRWLHKLRFGWLVPIAILFVLSFPPLFGHEIVAILCGLVWGLWVGFAIVAAGTYLGEVGNFYAFKACCRARGEKLEKSKISYACLAKVVRDGGVKIALIARLSAIPGHFATAVFSTCGMNILVFSIAAVLSLPKQLITVYLGVILEQSGTGESTSKSRLISDLVFVVTLVVTAVAMWYILREMNKVKPDVIYQRRRARIGKMMEEGIPLTSSTLGVDSDAIPLAMRGQRWDSTARRGSTEVELFAPSPERATDYSQGYQMIHESGHGRDEEAEWDASLTIHAGIVEPADGMKNIGNFPSAMSSSSTVYAPVPSGPGQASEALSQLQVHGGGASDQSDGFSLSSRTQTAQDAASTSFIAQAGTTQAHATYPSVDLPYRTKSPGTSGHRIASSPPPGYS